jgi:Putative prokaryotic signal transducing protein
MNSFIVVRTFDNYLLANMLQGRLEADGIRCHLKDENTVLADPFLSNAIGGIKLMVYGEDMEKAMGIIAAVESGRLEDDVPEAE